MTNQNLLSWVISRKTGLSSLTLWSVIMSIENENPSIPLDNLDFERCCGLLELCDPETKEQTLQKVAEKYKIWKPYVNHWAKLEQLRKESKIKDLYNLLQELEKQSAKIIQHEKII